jgi:hypothetical protein
MKDERRRWRAGLPARQAGLRMSAEIAAQIAAHAQSGYAAEVCGLIAGH